MLWIIGGALTALTTIALTVPLFRKRMEAQFQGREQAVYADQLAEVDRDKALGLISTAEAEAARTEVKRRMLSASRRGPAQKAALAGRGGWAIIATAILVPVLGVGTYLALGNPLIPSLPYAARAAERADAAKMDALVARLRARLTADPNSPLDGWVLLAQTYMRLSRPNQAIWVYNKLIDRGDATARPELFVLYAEAQIASDDGIVTPKAENALDRTLARQPGNVAAIYYKSLALEQSGELNKAYAMLRDRISRETSRQPWMGPLAERANFLARRIGETPVTLPASAKASAGSEG